MALNICHIIVTYIVLNHTYTRGCVRDSDFTVVKGLLVIVTLFLSDCCGCSLTCYVLVIGVYYVRKGQWFEIAPETLEAFRIISSHIIVFNWTSVLSMFCVV